MTSFEGCEAFDDLMKNPKLKSWFDECKDQVTNSKGSEFLHLNSIDANAKVLPKEETKPKKFGIF